ncbi:hypothetical protein GCM10027614_23280 [Micromonospora vulcania]
MGYAVVLGEALVDLLDTERDGERVYRQAIGGGRSTSPSGWPGSAARRSSSVRSATTCWPAVFVTS